MINDKQNLELVRLQMQQAESVRTHYQSPDVAVNIPVRQSAAISLPIAVLCSLLWFLAPMALDIWNSMPLSFLPEIRKPGFVEAAVYVLLTFVSVFLTSFLKVYRDRQDNWDSLIWNLEERLNMDLNGDNETGEPERSHGDRIDRVAHLVLERHYLDQQPSDRDACEEAGLCSQREWNIVNTILKKIGVKGERGYTVDDYQKALTEYRRRVSVFDDAILVKHAVGNGTERINLTN